MTDMNRPDKGSAYTARWTPPVMLSAKHARIAPLQMDRTVPHASFGSIQAPEIARRRTHRAISFIEYGRQSFKPIPFNGFCTSA